MDAEKELDIAVLDQYKAVLNQCAKVEKVDLSNFTCETFAKALHQTFAKAFHQTFAKPRVIESSCLGLFLQLAECLTTVYKNLACIDIFHDFLLDISPHNLKWKRRSCLMDVMIGDVKYIRGVYGSDIADRLLSIIQDISSREEADFQNFHQRERTCFERPLPHKSKSKVEVVVDPKLLKLRRSIEELFEQAGNCDIADDYNDELIDNLCSKVKKGLFSHSIVEVDTIAEILHYYPEFKPLEDELVNYVHDDIVTDCLIDGLSDGSSSYSTLECQNQFDLPGENSPFKDINWVLLILEEIVTQLRTDTPSTISETGLTRPEYVKIVTGDENAKIDEKINWISCVFSAELVAGGEAFNFPKCEYVLRKTLLSLVEHHKWIKSKFQTSRQELITNGEMVHLDTLSYDAMLYIVSYIREMKFVLKQEKARYLEIIDLCERIYDGSTVHPQLRVFLMKQVELSLSLAKTVAAFKLYLERPNKVLTPEVSKAFAMLGSELEQLVTFFNADE